MSTGVPISQLPAASNVNAADVVPGVQSGATKKFSFSAILAWLRSNITPANIGAQPTVAVSGILKGDGSGGISAAVAGTDYGTYSKPSGGIPASDLAPGVIPTVPDISTATPQMDGTAAAGSSGDLSDAGHVHPHDTAKADKRDLAYIQATGTTNTTGTSIGLGTFFYLNNSPVCAIQTISIGATFTEGTNYATASAGVANELRKSHIDTEVDLSGYSSSAYTFPRDGYLSLSAKGGSSYIRAAVYGSGGEGPFTTSAQGNSVSGSYFSNSVFVRTGMRMLVLQASGDTLARFYGLK